MGAGARGDPAARTVAASRHGVLISGNGEGDAAARHAHATRGAGGREGDPILLGLDADGALFALDLDGRLGRRPEHVSGGRVMGLRDAAAFSRPPRAGWPPTWTGC